MLLRSKGFYRIFSGYTDKLSRSHLVVCRGVPALFTLSVDVILISSQGAIILSLSTTPDLEIIGLAVVVGVDSEATGISDEEEGSGQDSMAFPVNLYDHQLHQVTTNHNTSETRPNINRNARDTVIQRLEKNIPMFKRDNRE